MSCKVHCVFSFFIIGDIRQYIFHDVFFFSELDDQSKSKKHSQQTVNMTSSIIVQQNIWDIFSIEETDVFV